MRTRENSVSISDLESLVQSWTDCATYRKYSKDTITMMRYIVGKLQWWMEHTGNASVGQAEIQAFLAYAGGPAPKEGRWGKKDEHRENRPRTVKTYWERLKTLFNWGVEQEMILSSPMNKIKAPVARPDQIQPFTEQQIVSILDAAKKTKNPVRNRAICLLLVDTGIRANELCTLQVQDLDLNNMRAKVLGKGNKHRTVYFKEATAEVLRCYLSEQSRRLTDPVFLGERGGQMTPSGLLQLMERLGKAAGLTGTRCSPHTFRHTASLWALRGGMNAFSLQQMLGHTDLAMTRRYVALAEGDLEAQHHLYSPVQHLMQCRPDAF